LKNSSNQRAMLPNPDYTSHALFRSVKVLLCENYVNREDSECTVIASGFCEAISWPAGRLLRRQRAAARNDTQFGCGWRPHYGK